MARPKSDNNKNFKNKSNWGMYGEIEHEYS